MKTKLSIIIFFLLTVMSTDSFAKESCNEAWDKQKSQLIIFLNQLRKIDKVKILKIIDSPKSSNQWLQNCEFTNKINRDIHDITIALSMYKMDNYQYPTTEQGLGALLQKPMIEPLPRRFPEGGYIKASLKDPWGRLYVYRSPGEGGTKSFDLLSKGAPSNNSHTSENGLINKTKNEEIGGFNSPEELLRTYRESLITNNLELMWSTYDLDVGDFSLFNNQLRSRLLPFLNIVKKYNYVYEGGDGLFSSFVDEISEIVFLTELEDRNLVKNLVFPPPSVIEKLNLKSYIKLRGKIREGLIALKVSHIELYERKPDSPQFGKVFIDVMFDGAIQSSTIGIVKNINSGWKIHADLITSKFKSKAGFFESNLEKLDQIVEDYNIKHL